MVTATAFTVTPPPTLQRASVEPIPRSLAGRRLACSTIACLTGEVAWKASSAQRCTYFVPSGA
jgi:hypothetical protein